MHMVNKKHLEFADKESKMCASDAQARNLDWEMNKIQKSYHLIGS